ncbi:MAG: hypothetical protein WDN23_00130 [Edaphobacter sp.]
MPTTRTITHILTVLFILAGLLLLRKPLFGQTINTVPARRIDAPSGQLIESSRTTLTSNAYRRISKVESLDSAPVR